MGGKGGGGVDYGPMLEYGDKALDLQKKIYEEGKQYAQPYYSAGTSALSKLQGLLGLSGGNTAQDRQALIDQYKGQFTTQSAPAATGGLNLKTGELLDLGGGASVRKTEDGYVLMGGGRQNFNVPLDENFNPVGGNEISGMGKDQLDAYNRLRLMNPVASAPASTTDTAALNAYIDQKMAEQNAAAQGSADYGSLLKPFSMENYQADPGYQFRLDEGNKALQRQLAAQGKTYSPEAAKALAAYAQGLASEEYGNAYNRYNIDQTNIYNRLANIAGLGQTASGQIAGVGQNYGNQASQIYSGIGNSIVGANAANASNNQSMFGSLLGAGAQLGGSYLSSNALSAALAASDRRLKYDITLVGEENGHNVYTFRYKGGDGKLWRGVMAQEVLEKTPEAVVSIKTEIGDVYAVNYDLIGVKFEEVA